MRSGEVAQLRERIAKKKSKNNCKILEIIFSDTSSGKSGLEVSKSISTYSPTPNGTPRLPGRRCGFLASFWNGYGGVVRDAPLLYALDPVPYLSKID